ncbi:MAG: hypothetical protein QM756_41275 [Polyangiaceae bacterium]
MRAIAWVFVSSLSLVVACGGAETKPAEAPTEAPLPPAEPPKAEAKPAPEPKPEAEPADAKPAAEPEKAPPAADAGEESSARNVKYVVNPEGMRVELEGVSFAPKAEAVKVAGGYGVKLKVEVKAKDGKPHSILAPKGAEVAFAGSVKRKEGEPEKFGDKREGDNEVALKGDKAAQLSRSWPPAGGPKPLSVGDELELMVGIWGLGEDAGSRRPLKKFCKVSVKFEKDKPKVSVTAPDGVGR